MVLILALVIVTYIGFNAVFRTESRDRGAESVAQVTADSQPLVESTEEARPQRAKPQPESEARQGEIEEPQREDAEPEAEIPQPESEPEREATPDAEPALRPPKYIPGLTAVDVHGNLTNKGFTLERDHYDAFELFGVRYPAGMHWTCEDTTPAYSMYVEVTGSLPTEIFEIEANFFNYSEDVTSTDAQGKDFVGYVASVPYEGSDPRRARAWVEENWGRNATTTIGGVIFKLNVNPDNPRFRWLVILAEPVLPPVDDEASTESDPTVPDPAPVDLERRAMQRLDLGKRLLEQDSAAGRRWLEDLIEEYPGTEAATEAQQLLDE